MQLKKKLPQIYFAAENGYYDWMFLLRIFPNFLRAFQPGCCQKLSLKKYLLLINTHRIYRYKNPVLKSRHFCKE